MMDEQKPKDLKATIGVTGELRYLGANGEVLKTVQFKGALPITQPEEKHDDHRD